MEDIKVTIFIALSGCAGSTTKLEMDSAMGTDRVDLSG